MSGILSVGPPDDDPPPRPLRWLSPFPFFAKTVNARLPLLATAGAGARGATGLRGRRIEPARALSEDEACDRAASMAENDISESFDEADAEVRATRGAAGV